MKKIHFAFIILIVLSISIAGCTTRINTSTSFTTITTTLPDANQPCLTLDAYQESSTSTEQHYFGTCSKSKVGIISQVFNYIYEAHELNVERPSPDGWETELLYPILPPGVSYSDNAVGCRYSNGNWTIIFRISNQIMVPTPYDRIDVFYNDDLHWCGNKADGMVYETGYYSKILL